MNFWFSRTKTEIPSFPCALHVHVSGLFTNCLFEPYVLQRWILTIANRVHMRALLSGNSVVLDYLFPFALHVHVFGSFTKWLSLSGVCSSEMDTQHGKPSSYSVRSSFRQLRRFDCSFPFALHVHVFISFTKWLSLSAVSSAEMDTQHGKPSSYSVRLCDTWNPRSCVNLALDLGTRFAIRVPFCFTSRRSRYFVVIKNLANVSRWGCSWARAVLHGYFGLFSLCSHFLECKPVLGECCIFCTVFLWTRPSWDILGDIDLVARRILPFGKTFYSPRWNFSERNQELESFTESKRLLSLQFIP